MQPLLYLVHRIPYPPNKGDKIRSFNILKYLSNYYDIYLGSFIDAPEDLQYKEKLKEFCKETHIETINPKIAKVKSLTGLFSGKALSIPYYASNSMQVWVNKTIKQHNIKKTLAFSSPMAQFLMGHTEIDRIMDFVDIDSDKWQQYTNTHTGVMNLIYKREAKYLFKYEKHIANSFNASLFVSDKEADYFQQLIQYRKSQILGVSNGIDFEFFDPELEYQSPYKPNEKNLVFTGAMDYWANCDAVIWFANEVFPKLYAKDKSYRFIIVGSNPTKEVKDLTRIEGVDVTGRVEDIRPYIKHAHIAVAPLRIARGIQNKVLEALAMNKVVVATSNAMEGIEINPEIEQNIKDNEQEIVDCIINLSQNDDIDSRGENAGKWVRQKYSWETVLEPLMTLLE
ncbi:MAG: TIGR03087 family PEP-CTERM/XrtA system glycosyltransferase [Gammaproteobacteria bacterium]|nr:TIGR03087 family PEP-CTERM/XrtA system glycosyltransferase [Gammaproteobacteria bacterium]